MSQPSTVAIVFGVALGATAAIGVALGWTEPYWVPEPVLLLTLYVLMILIGTGILVVGLAIVKALGDWETERHPDAELA